eukprot:TRINITY_DN7499_c0_g1_i1.p1 TRINITY_DN7499_c0_g1~~TRINITY_DN7499_c0_g1_i1.p1  ORF type:complete len:284 (-),score=47.08 TRINITY_DN7499_c0_g1_i1:79-930(-)
MQTNPGNLMTQPSSQGFLSSPRQSRILKPRPATPIASHTPGSGFGTPPIQSTTEHGASPEANSPTSRKLVSEMSRKRSGSAKKSSGNESIRFPDHLKKDGPLVTDRALELIPKVTLNASEVGCNDPMPSRESLGNLVEVNVEGSPGWRRKTDNGSEIVAVLQRISREKEKLTHVIPKCHPFVRLVFGNPCAPDEFMITKEPNKEAPRVPAVIRYDKQKGWVLELFWKAPGRIGKLIVKPPSGEEIDSGPQGSKMSGNTAYRVRLADGDNIDVCQTLFTFNLTA